MPPGKVGFVFAGDEINITTWVERMHVHAGAYSNQDWEGRGRSPRSMQKNLMLLFKSRPMVRSLFVARHGVQPLLKNAVKNLLLAMNKDRAGRRVLKKYYKVKKYDLIDGEVKESLNEARKYYHLIQGQFK